MKNVEVEIQVDGITFICNLDNFYLRRQGMKFNLYYDEIESGEANDDALLLSYQLELNSHLGSYRKALDKVKKLKVFL